MAMMYSHYSVTAPANGEDTVRVIEEWGDVPYTLHGLTCDSNSSLDLLLYREGKKKVDIPSDVRPLNNDWLPIGEEISAGETVRVGFRNSSGSSITAVVTVQYELTGGR